MTEACSKCGHEEYDPLQYPQYTVEGQDLLDKEKKVRPLCKTHKMENTFLPSRGQYQKCWECGYFTCTHGGSYY